MGAVPPGVSFLRRVRGRDFGLGSYQASILVITFVTYTLFHASRKPPSIVKSSLDPDDAQTNSTGPWSQPVSLDSNPGWAPFNGRLGEGLLGELDVSFLAAYAMGMFVSGHLGDRMDLRLLLTVGMVGTGVFTILFGLANFLNIHSLPYFVAVQAIAGLFQSTGWPCVVAVVSNWQGKKRRGLVMGIWNVHTSLGNILGALVAAAVLDWGWGWSFVVPGLAILAGALLTFCFLVPQPQDVNFPSPHNEFSSPGLELTVKRRVTEDERAALLAGRAPVSRDEGSWPSELTSRDEDRWRSGQARRDEGGWRSWAATRRGEDSWPEDAPGPDRNVSPAWSSKGSVWAAKEGVGHLHSVDGGRVVRDQRSAIDGFAETLGRMEKAEVGGDLRGLDGWKEADSALLVEGGEGNSALLVDGNGTDDERLHGSGEGEEVTGVGFWEACCIPGVAVFAFTLFFSKMVAYTFLYWLPFYIKHTDIDGLSLPSWAAGDLSTVFDIGGVVGGISAGYLSDHFEARALTATSFFYASIPSLWLYYLFGHLSFVHNIALLFVTGALVNGPYSLITTAVSADLGTHESVRGSARAIATVAAIIDGTGSVGAALGPFLTGWLAASGNEGWTAVFAMLSGATLLAGLLLTGLACAELRGKLYASRSSRDSGMDLTQIKDGVRLVAERMSGPMRPEVGSRNESDLGLGLRMTTIASIHET